MGSNLHNSSIINFNTFSKPITDGCCLQVFVLPHNVPHKNPNKKISFQHCNERAIVENFGFYYYLSSVSKRVGNITNKALGLTKLY